MLTDLMSAAVAFLAGSTAVALARAVTTRMHNERKVRG